MIETEGEGRSAAPLPRATYVLLLLDADDARPIHGRTRMEKLAFLVQKRVIEGLKVGVTQDTYHFRADQFGPFTEEVFDDLSALRVLSLINVSGEDDSSQVFRITPKGREVVKRLLQEGRVSPLLADEIKKIKTAFGRLRLDDLLARVYHDYPEVTIMSQIRGKYF